MLVEFCISSSEIMKLGLNVAVDSLVPKTGDWIVRSPIIVKIAIEILAFFGINSVYHGQMKSRITRSWGKLKKVDFLAE